MLLDRLDVRKHVAGAANAMLIVGGAGGVGLTATQLARALTAVTTPSEDKIRSCRSVRLHLQRRLALVLGRPRSRLRLREPNARPATEDRIMNLESWTPCAEARAAALEPHVQ